MANLYILWLFTNICYGYISANLLETDLNKKLAFNDQLSSDSLQDIEDKKQQQDFPLGIPDEEQNVPGEPLTPQDFANAKNIEFSAPVLDENSPDPIQSAGLFEGDIAGVNISDFVLPVRNAIKNTNLRWADGVVPYALSSAFNIYERSVIAAAVQDYEENTCIRFVPRTVQKDYIYILKGSGCSSLVGRSGAGQQVSLGAGCIYKGVIIHELMHALGFWHEQSRPDRDNYVRVLWQNIIRGMEYNFNKYTWDMVQSLGVDYDTSSVMHYTSMSFSKDGRSPTIVPRQLGIQFIGQRVGFSDSDLLKINRLYRCKEPRPPTIKPPPDEQCRDQHHMCSYWTRIGECHKNPSWMLFNCRKSCQQCSEACKNHNKECEFWASIGECTKNPSYMTIYCARSCNSCESGDNSGQCTDDNQHCSTWANDNQCVVNPSYMLRFCRRSCQQC